MVINGEGYVLLDAYRNDANAPQKAVYAFTPTFVPRQNTQGDYGDDSQAFWMTFSQKDWSLGEQQRFYRSTNEPSKSKYWEGSKVDVTHRPGSVMIRKDTASFAAATTVKAVCNNQGGVHYMTTANLYTVETDGTRTDRGAHGLGAAPKAWGMWDDDHAVWMTTTGVGTVGVRKWNTGAGFVTFSASAADSIIYHNNALYGYEDSTAKLYRWNSAGTRTELFQWKNGAGSAASFGEGRILPYGGDIVILRVYGGSNRSELWLYDGDAPAMIDMFPSTFEAYDFVVLAGIVFVGGRHVEGNSLFSPAIHYYSQGSTGMLWKSDETVSSGGYVSITDYGHDLMFTDDAAGKLMIYNLANSGVHSAGAYTVAGDTPRLANSFYHVIHTRNQATVYRFPSASTATTATLTTSLFDGESSLTKLFRGIRVEFDMGEDGDGGSVDIAYRLEDFMDTFTTLQAGANSGTEYTLSGVSGKSISVKITLNKGTSTDGPMLKRIGIRAVPLQQTFKRRRYILALYGRDGEQPILLRDNTQHSKDGLTMAQDLSTAATATAPFTITDKLGSFTGIIEAEGFELNETRPEEFVAQVTVREV